MKMMTLACRSHQYESNAIGMTRNEYTTTILRTGGNFVITSSSSFGLP